MAQKTSSELAWIVSLMVSSAGRPFPAGSWKAAQTLAEFSNNYHLLLKEQKKKERRQLDAYDFRINLTYCFVLKFSTLWELSFCPRRQKFPILLKWTDKAVHDLAFCRVYFLFWVSFKM